ncbi:MAG TPA: Wzz/FepE/Etk N-terminal domain-containing protein [Steroidobacteraceae bacterium]|nr:Wzz/FepE/Etk N-terminal domain-containing protein [Steroidobacteraceae bacterium]
MTIFSRNAGTAITVALPEPNLAAIPEQVSHQGMSIAQFSAILLAYWIQIAVIAVVAASVAAIFIKLLPKTYTATATLIVSSDVKDPLAGRDFPAEMISNYVSTQIELLTSPIVLLPVVRQLDLMHDKDFAGNFNGSPDALREVVQKKLADAIRVERGTGGQLIFLSVSSKSAERAAQLANAVADVYIDQDRRRLNEPAAERAQRYTEELAELRGKVSTAQEKVAAFGKENGIGDMTSASAGVEEQALDALHQHLLETQNVERALESKNVGSPSADAPAGATGSVLSSQTLLDTELAQLAQLSSTYGPQHPKVRELNLQIALTRQALVDQKRALTANTQSQLAQTKELEQKYQRAIAEQDVKVAKVREAQAEGGKLLLELESAKAVYKQALDGFDQIMFQAVANHTNVSVVSPAFPPLRPSKPNKAKLMMMALLAAVGLGVAGPLGYGLFVARRLRCRDDMERDFGIAVLAQLDAVHSLGRAT